MDIGKIFSDENLSHLKLKEKKYKNLLDTNGVILFGSGNLGKKMLIFFQSINVKVFCFVDNNKAKHGQMLNGIEILSPEKAVDFFSSQYPCWIISIWSPGHSFKETKIQLLKFGIKNIIPINNIFQIYNELLLPYYHFETADYYLANKEKIEQAYSLLNDLESKEQYLRHLRVRLGESFEELPISNPHNQYFPSDVVKLSPGEIFLDCGAYTGDTLADFIKFTNRKYNKYYCLEPDPKNLESLKNNIINLNAPSVEIFEVAVSNENTVLKFDATGGGGAGISKTGSILVKCVRVDDYFSDNFSFIKMDIEGAELDALKGAQNTILHCKPKLAICIYHLPNDLWEIILYINKTFPFYTFYTRTHQYDGLDFVLYAIPKD